MSRFKKRDLALAAMLSGVLLASGLLPSCAQKSPAGPPDAVVVGWSPFESTALLLIAEDLKFFDGNHLDVTLRRYDTGVASLDAVFQGDADISVGVTEFPVVRRVLEKSDVRIIGAAAKIDQQYLVARKDRGIAQISDLKGKKVGTTFRTVAEFYLGRLLELNGIKLQDVAVVDLKTPAEWENAVADGVVDAIVTAQPYADMARKRLGENAIAWQAQSGQYVFGLVVSSEQWVNAHPDEARRFVNALQQAEQYAIRNPAGAQAIMQKGLGVSAEFAESAWARDQFALSLDQSLITVMEDQARWMIKNQLTKETSTPDFAEYIYLDGLRAVRPESVSIR